MTSPVHHVTFDCHDAHALGTFWAAALGGRLSDDDQPGDPEALVTYPGGTPLLFVTVDDATTVKNRVHLA
ncbi:MAG: Glyoxalase-like domain protein [Frankiales bacterium]|nr:Glyoxalase-like domain protein [Frankiales bacterium]